MSGPGNRRRSPHPAIILLGAMKCGTTTLFDRLGQHPDIWLPPTKEPNYFSTAHERGPDWYRSLFDGCPPHQRTLEASVSYADPLHSTDAAARIADAVPDVRLVVLLRDPEARARAHYLHEVQRGRERRPFSEATAEEGNPYLRRSCYSTGLRPFLEGPLRSALLGLRTDDLDDDGAWVRLLEHLGLTSHPRPSTVRNVGAAKAPMTRLGGVAYRRDGLALAQRLPAPLRRLGRRAVFAPSGATADLRASADAALPPAVRAHLAEEAARATASLGLDGGWG